MEIQGWRKYSNQASLLNNGYYFMKMWIKFPFQFKEKKTKVVSSWLVPNNAKLAYQAVSVPLTWATIRGQVTVAVSIACCAAVDGAVIVIVPSIRPRVCQPWLRGRFTDVEKSWPKEKNMYKSKFYISSK